MDETSPDAYLKLLLGKSGTVHAFDEIVEDSGIEKVTEIHSEEVDEFRVISFYAKTLDIAARSVEMVAPSYTARAAELAREYRIKLRLTPVQREIMR